MSNVAKARIILKWLARDIGYLLVPAYGCAAIGYYLDQNDQQYMTRYRDRSSLYGKVREEGEPYVPSWP